MVLVLLVAVLVVLLLINLKDFEGSATIGGFEGFLNWYFEKKYVFWDDELGTYWRFLGKYESNLILANILSGSITSSNFGGV